MSDSSPTAEQTSSPAAGSGGFNVYAVIVLLLLAAVCGWAAYVYITGKDGFSWRRFAFLGEKKVVLVPITGEVYYNGKPVENGVVEFYPADDEADTRKAIGALKEGGKFELYTDIDGMKEGAVAGDYIVVLNVNHPNQPGQLAPSRMLPDKYYRIETTPVRATVSADPEKKHITIRETGDPATPGPGANRGKKKTGRRGVDPQAIIERIMAGDSNGDGKISREEASDRLKPRFDQFDSNGDGQLDKQELEAGLRSGRGRKRKQKRPNPAKSSD